MRAQVSVVVLAAGAVVVACAHDGRARGESSGPQAPQNRSTPPPAATPYVVADPSSKSSVLPVPLGASGERERERPSARARALGIVVDRRRAVVGQGDARVARETTREPIAGAARLPGRLGAGFLFWTAKALYRADVFDGPLVPIASVPEAIESVSFAPRSVFVRTHDGARWSIGLPSGQRMPIAPLGVADLQALDDGRVIAMTDQGAVFTSLDGGERYADATAQVRSSPLRTEIAGDDLWLVESNGGASRLERDGRLSWFDKGPPDSKSEPRPNDPRWHGTETPLRTALHSGAAAEDATAVVLEGGDLVRVDLRTGEIVSVLPGRFPPDATCEAVPTPGDVLFACAAKNTAGATSFVVSRTLTSEPVVEQTLSGGGTFYASDDGGLAYSAPCSGVSPAANAPPAVCVRLPGGRWEDRDLGGMLVDGGAVDANVARWVPRADGRVVAIVVEPNAGIYDPSAATFLPIDDDAKEVVGRTASFVQNMFTKGGPRVHRRFNGGAGLVDNGWSYGADGVLRGWQRHAESVAIAEDGRVKRSAYALETIYSGAWGLGRSKDGRLYQSVDHGGTWVEVAPPPSGIESSDLAACSSAGCDLGAFYRIGWPDQPPVGEPPKPVAPDAPSVRLARGLELACRPASPVTSKFLPRTPTSPEDLGLGAARLATAGDGSAFSFVRNTVPKSIVSPVHDVGSGDNGDGSPSLRALFSGFGTTSENGTLVVTGPSKNVLGLRRGFAYAAPFDPKGSITRTAIAMSDVVAAGRRGGMTMDEILGDDPTETGVAVVLTSADPSAPSDVAIHNVDHGFLSIARGERVRVVLHPSQSSGNVVSGATLSGDESAFLEVDGSGVGHVFKVSGTPPALSDLFDVSPTSDGTYYPANPDALAVGPKGELALLRTPSGLEPPSDLDPAFVIVPAMPPTRLPSWSESKLADDPLCKAEPGGWRATVQAIGPWIHLTAPELRVADDAPMLVRVRWTSKRPCLEGFEVRLPNVQLRSASGADPVSLATWLVAKGGTFARIGLGEGVEWRQALECTPTSAVP